MENDLTIFPLQPRDSAELAALLAAELPAYIEHFTPFAFDADSLAARFAAARRNRYWGIRVGEKLVGFFMLRGFDEGYARPAFGVYVASAFASRGLAKLALHFSLAWCRCNGIPAVMLKVAPDNVHARRIYAEAGFTDAGLCPRTGHQTMEFRWGK